MKSYEKVRQVREQKGFSLEEIATLLCTTPRQLKKWESGETKMKFHHYVSLARCYNVSLDYFAGLTDICEPLYENE